MTSSLAVEAIDLVKHFGDTVAVDEATTLADRDPTPRAVESTR